MKYQVHFYVPNNFYFGGDSLNSDTIVKGRIDGTLNEAFKKIITALNLTQQEFIEESIKKFVLENINLLMVSDKDK